MKQLNIGKPIGEGFYKVLGISSDATIKEIKLAYRNLVQHLHPDKKAGDEEKFREVTEAYATLIDPVKREEYDLTGQPAISQKEIDSRAQFIITETFNQVYIKTAQKLKYVNVVDVIKKTINNGIENGEKEVVNKKEELETIKDAIERIEYKGDVNFIKIFLEVKEQEVRQQIYLTQTELKAGKKAYEMISDYSFKFEEQPFMATSIGIQWG